jgi:hypothetical protein
LQGLGVVGVPAAARPAPAEAGLTAGSRVLTTRDWSVSDGLVEVPLAVLAAGGSLVQCRNLDPAKVAARAASERVTHQLD